MAGLPGAGRRGGESETGGQAVAGPESAGAGRGADRAAGAVGGFGGAPGPSDAVPGDADGTRRPTGERPGAGVGAPRRADRDPGPDGAGVHPAAGAAPFAGDVSRTTVLEGDEARVPRVLRELDGAASAHIAAHGTFRADSPLFSSLRMADGPLIVHDFERLDRSPYRIILSCCDTARFASVGADELLGLVTALLPLGTAGVVACSAPVNDAAVVPLMLSLHKGLDAGLSLAEALRDARAALPDDAVHRATGWAFSAFGAA